MRLRAEAAAGQGSVRGQRKAAEMSERIVAWGTRRRGATRVRAGEEAAGGAW